MSRFECIIAGLVQGVGFRAWVKRKATALNITGEVRNMPDGTVRVIAEGKDENLQVLLKLLRTGPSESRVDNTVLKTGTARGELSTFEVVY